MRGRVTTFIGSVVMIMIGVGIIWWFRSVMPSEAFIVSERHKESFSTLNYAELARKTLEEAVLVYAQTGATKAGATGGLDNLVPQKDKIAIWKTPPNEATIKDTLKRYIVDEIASLQQHPIIGKFLTIDYGVTDIQVIPDNSDLSASEKFYVKGDKGVEASKGLETQAIKIKTGLKGYIDQTAGLKYFALYDTAKKFLESGEPKKRIDAAFSSVDTKGTGEKKPVECDASYVPTWCGSADHTIQTCPVPIVDYPTDQEVLAQSSFSQLGSVADAISATIIGAPFESFKARFDKYEVLPTAGYNPADVVTDDTGTCGFSCKYENQCNAPIPQPSSCNNGCTYDPVADSCEQPVCGGKPACSSCSYDETEDLCVAPTCGAPIPATPVCDNGCSYNKASNSCASPVNSKSCTANTKKKTITFTFLVDAYEKYSSEDPNGFVPSKSLNNVPVVAKLLPYETLKFNYMTHSCSMIKTGQLVTTDLKEDTSACSLPAGMAPV